MTVQGFTRWNICLAMLCLVVFCVMAVAHFLEPFLFLIGLLVVAFVHNWVNLLFADWESQRTRHLASDFPRLVLGLQTILGVAGIVAILEGVLLLTLGSEAASLNTKLVCIVAVIMLMIAEFVYGLVFVASTIRFLLGIIRLMVHSDLIMSYELRTEQMIRAQSVRWVFGTLVASTLSAWSQMPSVYTSGMVFLCAFSLLIFVMNECRGKKKLIRLNGGYITLTVLIVGLAFFVNTDHQWNAIWQGAMLAEYGLSLGFLYLTGRTYQTYRRIQNSKFVYIFQEMRKVK